MAYEERSDRFAEGVHSLAGYRVYDRHYEKIGEVDDLFVDEDDRPEYIGVKMGFLGTRSTLIPIEIVRANDKRQLVEVAADKDTVKEGPTFGDDREITPGFERRVLNYYRIETAEARERSGERHPSVAMGHVDRERGRDLGDKNELRVQRSEEKLRAGTREREASGVNARKRVRTDHERLRVPKRREEGHVGR